MQELTGVLREFIEAQPMIEVDSFAELDGKGEIMFTEDDGIKTYYAFLKTRKEIFKYVEGKEMPDNQLDERQIIESVNKCLDEFESKIKEYLSEVEIKNKQFTVNLLNSHAEQINAQCKTKLKKIKLE